MGTMAGNVAFDRVMVAVARHPEWRTTRDV
jgi:hypothetical protein